MLETVFPLLALKWMKYVVSQHTDGLLFLTKLVIVFLHPLTSALSLKTVLL